MRKERDGLSIAIGAVCVVIGGTLGLLFALPLLERSTWFGLLPWWAQWGVRGLIATAGMFVVAPVIAVLIGYLIRLSQWSIRMTHRQRFMWLSAGLVMIMGTAALSQWLLPPELASLVWASAAAVLKPLLVLGVLSLALVGILWYLGVEEEGSEDSR